MPCFGEAFELLSRKQDIKMKKIVFFLTLTILFGQDYVGSKKCKSCHKKKSNGAQFQVWEDSKHAEAFEVLKTPAAKETALKKGIETNPWETPECVRCHTTGYGKGGYEIKDTAFWEQKTERGKPTKEVKRMTYLQGVGCEVCHGPGSKYKSKKKMKAIFEGKISMESLGMILPTEETCKGCHNKESPTFTAFHFEEMFLTINHPYPDGFREKK